MHLKIYPQISLALAVLLRQKYLLELVENYLADLRCWDIVHFWLLSQNLYRTNIEPLVCHLD